MGTELDRPADLPAIAAPDPVTRRAEIESVMRTDFDAYERRGLAREYHELIEGELEEANPDSVDPTRPMAPDRSYELMRGTPAGKLLVQHWESMGGYKANLERAQKAARGIVSQFGARKEQRAFLERFNRDVPELARVAIYADLAFGKPTFVQPVEQDDIDHFASEPIGRELVEEWGQWAPENIAIVLKRMDRIWDTLHEEDAMKLADWFDALPDRQAKHVVASLVR